MFKRSLLLLPLFLLLACSDDDCGCTVYDTQFAITVLNASGDNLLDPEHPAGIDHDAIRLFYEIDGMVEEVYDPTLDNPRNFEIHSDGQDGAYKIWIHPNHIQSENRPVTYIDWNENDRDTIACEFDYSGNNTTLKKVWYNGGAVGDSETSGVFEFTIVK